MKLVNGDILIYTNSKGVQHHWMYVGDGFNGNIQYVKGKTYPSDDFQPGDVDNFTYPTYEKLMNDIRPGGFVISKENKVRKLLKKIDEL